MRRAALCLALVIGSGMTPTRIAAQFTDPCALACIATLALDSYVVGTGSAAAVGRVRGGFSTTRQGVVSWSTGFLVTAGGGLALYGDGGRQRRAVYSGALGAVAGGVVGLTLESLIGESTAATRLSATMIGAALGVLVGGTTGALTHAGSDADQGLPITLFSVSLSR